MPRRRTRAIWTKQQLQQLQRLDEIETEHAAILRSLRQYRTKRAIATKRMKLRIGLVDKLESSWVHENSRTVEASRPSDEALRERDRRLAQPTSMFGDPPRGYSALDRMEKAA